MKFVMTAVVEGAPRRRATGNRFRFGGDDTRDKARWESWMIRKILDGFIGMSLPWNRR